eukprot:TRINITY_DN66494_c0_g1_i1.p1 TRINITY_DN66494_c0_g1~~TRINITY_DN66494_c0_g1_i1.p1  ORF type:complete len:259 (+),score=49.17 TRINITY_DN66494_c0_g1_i1:73-849(+)
MFGFLGGGSAETTEENGEAAQQGSPMLGGMMALLGSPVAPSEAPAQESLSGTSPGTSARSAARSPGRSPKSPGQAVDMGGRQVHQPNQDQHAEAHPSKMPLDPDLKFHRTAAELHHELIDRDFNHREQTEVEHVRLADVEGEMDELKTDKDGDDAVIVDIKRNLEALTRNTVKVGGEANVLNASRICQIENRMKNDPTLQLDDLGDGAKGFEWPEHASNVVKKQLELTYRQIKKGTFDLSAVTQHQLDERISILSRTL